MYLLFTVFLMNCETFFVDSAKILSIYCLFLLCTDFYFCAAEFLCVLSAFELQNFYMLFLCTNTILSKKPQGLFVPIPDSVSRLEYIKSAVISISGNIEHFAPGSLLAVVSSMIFIFNILTSQQTRTTKLIR